MDFYAPGLDTVTASEEGAEMTVMTPSGAPLKRKDGAPVKITLMGADSERYRELSREARRRNEQRRADGEQLSPEQEVAESCEFLARMTVRWNVQFDDGKGGAVDAPCNTTNATAFYKAFPAARDQADVFIVRRVNFTKASSGD
jgi:hypothetical protein